MSFHTITTSLASTGAEIAPWVIGAIAVLLVAGVALFLIGRRRRGGDGPDEG